MNHPKVVFYSAILACCFATAEAKSDDPWEACKISDINGLTTLVICPSGLEVDDLQKAGVKACGERTPCGMVWIWDDAENAPKRAPKLATDMTQNQIKSAVAVWVHEKQNLITIAAEQK